MKMNFKTSRSLPFYFCVVGLFLIIASPNLFSDGMFMDGLIYATVAKNMAHGLGTFWNPQFTTTFMTDFHEHPPLAFGIQSLFFTLFGDSRLIEKIYSLLAFAVTGYIILKIWKSFGYKHGWLPLLLWLSIPLVNWACCNNMLENTLTIFTSMSILFYLKREKSKKYFFIFLSGLMLALGFLTKGFVAFFPWTFPFMMWLFLKQKSFGSMVKDTAGIFFFTVVPLLLLFLLSPEANLSIHKYLDTQVVNSLKNVVTVESRFFIIKKLFSELIPAFIICFIFLMVSRIKKVSLKFTKESKHAWVFICLGFTGVLPIMISMKQSGFYVLATFPLFAIGLSILLYPLVNYLFEKINYRSGTFLIFKWIGGTILCTGIFLSVFFANKIGRDRTKLKDIYLVLSELSEGSIINISPNLWDDWGLHGYFGRYKNVSLDSNLKNERAYLLILNENYSDTLNRNYKMIDLPTTDYKLFKRK